MNLETNNMEILYLGFGIGVTQPQNLNKQIKTNQLHG